MRMIAKFSKTGEIKFCSHLDIQRVFIRAIARAGLPVKFSQGFNKHPLLSMALALPLGESSQSEYIDITMEEEISAQSFIEMMNNSLPQGVRIVDAKMVSDEIPSLTSLVYAADYRMIFENPIDIEQKVFEILQRDDIIIEKKTKSGTTPTDIRHMILNLEHKESAINCRIRCGQVNLKPKDLIGVLTDRTDYSVERIAIYTNVDENLSELFSFL